MVKKFKNLSGKENQDYLKENFEAAWTSHDVKGKNLIDVTEAYQMLNEL